LSRPTSTAVRYINAPLAAARLPIRTPSKGSTLLSVHRHHQIPQSTHSILNPFLIDKPSSRTSAPRHQVRLSSTSAAAGGEMLRRFASRFGTTGAGVDIHPPLIEQAKGARTLDDKHTVEFQLGDGAALDPKGRTFDIVASIGTSWIGGGLVGTLDMNMMRALAADGAQAQNI
jgi:hypothetical protein